MRQTPLIIVTLTALSFGWGSNAYSGGFPVFDSANFAKNLLVAYQTAQQLKKMSQQIQTYKGAAFGDVDRRVMGQQQELNRFLRQLHAIGYRLESVRAQFNALFPKGRPPKNLAEYRAQILRWHDELRNAALASMQAQSSIDQIYADNREIQRVLSQSQTADGTVRQLQSTNRLLGVMAMKLTELWKVQATTARLAATATAIKNTRESQAREEERRFWSNHPLPPRVKPWKKLP